MTRPKTSLDQLIRDALPSLMRARIIDAVLKAQRIEGEPVTARQARAVEHEPLMQSPRSFSDAANAIARMGPDESGRVLHRVAMNRKRIIRWWVEEPRGGAQ